MRGIMIGAIALAAGGMVISACTTHEVRVVGEPAIVGAPPGSTQTTIRTDGRAPVVIQNDEPRDIIVKVD
jgi:hypothetical protein